MTTLTKSQKTVLRYYLGLKEERFYRSLEHIRKDTKLSAKTVQRANSLFRELGLLTWVPGFENRQTRARGCANQYKINLAALRRAVPTSIRE